MNLRQEILTYLGLDTILSFNSHNTIQSEEQLSCSEALTRPSIMTLRKRRWTSRTRDHVESHRDARKSS